MGDVTPHMHPRGFLACRQEAKESASRRLGMMDLTKSLIIGFSPGQQGPLLQSACKRSGQWSSQASCSWLLSNFNSFCSLQFFGASVKKCFLQERPIHFVCMPMSPQPPQVYLHTWELVLTKSKSTRKTTCATLCVTRTFGETCFSRTCAHYPSPTLADTNWGVSPRPLQGDALGL